MRHGKRGGLLRKGERKFPDQNHRGIHENGKRPVLKFAGEVAADPGVRAQQRKVAFGPAPCDVGENGQDRKLVIVIPEKKRIVPEQHEAKGGDNCSRSERTEEVPVIGDQVNGDK